MRIHFFAAPFYFAFIEFKVQGSGGGFAAFSEKILFEYVFFCAFVNDSGNFLNNNIKMIHDLKIGISNNEDSELF